MQVAEDFTPKACPPPSDLSHVSSQFENSERPALQQLKLQGRAGQWGAALYCIQKELQGNPAAGSCLPLQTSHTPEMDSWECWHTLVIPTLRLRWVCFKFKVILGYEK